MPCTKMTILLGGTDTVPDGGTLPLGGFFLALDLLPKQPLVLRLLLLLLLHLSFVGELVLDYVFASKIHLWV